MLYFLIMEEISFTIQSDYPEAAKISDKLCFIASETSHREDLVTINLTFILNELLNNAIRHGNRSLPDKKIRITGKIGPDVILISVKDEGGGFNIKNLAAGPELQEDILSDGGRGIFLARYYADLLFFSEGGTRVTFALFSRRKPAVCEVINGLGFIMLSEKRSYQEKDLKGIFNRFELAEIKLVCFQMKHIQLLFTPEINLIINRLKALRESGGDIVFLSPSPEILKLIRVTGLEKIIRTYPLLEDILSKEEKAV